MAFQTGSASDLDDLLSKMMTFAVANGWTQDDLDTVNGEAALSKNSVFISMAWDSATPQHLSLHQALAYTAATQPGLHTDDSGNGYNTTSNPTDAQILSERCVDDIGDGPFPSYYFFEDEVYLHIVVETATDIFRHFGFGELEKFGTWTGGEYCYGQYIDASIPTSVGNTCLLDGLFDDAQAADFRRAATLRAESLPGQTAGTKWGQICGTRTRTLPTDTAGNAKIAIQGGYRGGPIARNFGWLPAASTTGLIAMYPIALFYDDRTNNNVYFLGYMPEVRGLNIKNFAPKDEVTVGSDTWVVFPQSQKTNSVTSDRSYNAGIAYKKVTT